MAVMMYKDADGNWQVLPSVGPRGPAGQDGVNGASAYELAVAQGYTGTLAEWLAEILRTTDIANNLTTADTGKVLDARQGKELNDNLVAALADKLRGGWTELWTGSVTPSATPIAVPNWSEYCVIALVVQNSTTLAVVSDMGQVSALSVDVSASSGAQNLRAVILSSDGDNVTYQRGSAISHLPSGAHSAVTAPTITAIYGVIKR